MSRTVCKLLEVPSCVPTSDVFDEKLPLKGRKKKKKVAALESGGLVPTPLAASGPGTGTTLSMHLVIKSELENLIYFL